MFKSPSSTLASALVLAATLPASAATRVVPAQPTAFERVTLRMTVDSCAFNPATVRVRSEGNTLKVTQQPNNCLVAGTPQDVEVRLGSLAAGEYRVEVHASPSASASPAERLSFTVTEPAEVAIFPPPARPLADYSGLWWNPQESGWGLSLHQGPLNAVFGAWFIYAANGEPQWYTIQGGQWVDSTTWRGTIYRTTGPYFAGPGYDPRLVLVVPSGSATLDFRVRAGEEDRARFTYTVGGVTATQSITRMAF